MTKVLVWGASGHAKVLRPLIERSGRKVVTAVERNPAVLPAFSDIPIIRSDDEVAIWAASNPDSEFVLAIGGHNGAERERLAKWLCGFGLKPLTLIHQTSFVAESTRIGEGSHVLALAAVCEEAFIGHQTIINTKASVDHECRLGIGVHIMPGATLAGLVEVGDYATVGSGATVLPRIRIGSGAMIGAGSVVTKDVAVGVIVMGVPARPI